jgi:hypothetical protein
MSIQKPKKEHNDVTIVINSCDAYADVWPVFFSAFKEYWPDCKYNIMLNTESSNYICGDLDITNHNSSRLDQENAWGLRLRETLKDVRSEYVLMVFDDFVLDGKVNLKKIEQSIVALRTNPEISVFYFTNVGVENIDDEVFPGFDLVPPKADYRLNSAPAIWRKEDLLRFTGEYDNPWTWEFFGSYRTYKPRYKFYCAKKAEENIYPYSYSLGGAIYRGKWVSSVVAPVIKKHKLNIDLELRGVVNESDRLTSRRTLRWKIDFFILGFKMIGLGAFLFLYRVLKKKIITRLLKNGS